MTLKLVPLSQVTAAITRVQESLHDNRTLTSDEREAAVVACEDIAREVEGLGPVEMPDA